MELAKKSKKQCKKLKKLKPESPAKKLKIDTPCKGVDAKCSIKKKKNLICVNINKLNNKYTKNSSSKNNSIKVFNNFRRKKLDVDKKLNEKKSSALTENVKGQTCNDKMTKVAAPVVKMVEPLLELIDFEEEIKVEKISKDKNSDIIISDYKNFDYEKEIDKNTIKNIENIKGKEKINIVSLEINSNSTDSNLSEYSSKLVISEIPENKYVIPRRNPSRRISQKGERIVKKKIEQQNVEIVNKKRQAKKEVNSTLKNKDLPLTYKDSNQNTNTSVLGKKKIAKHEEKSSNNVSHVPTMVEAIPPSSTSKMNVNTDSKTENLEIEKLENAKIKKNTQNKKREYFKSNIKKVSNKTNIKVDNILEAEKIENKECEEKQNDQISNVKDESLSTLSNQGLAIDSITENVQNNTSEVIVELNFYNKQEEEFRSLENVNESIAINSFNPKNENQENNFQEKNQEISEYISTFNTECLSSNVLEENSSPYIADNLKSNQENIQSQRSSNEFDENITSHTQCELVAEVKEKDKKQETIPNEEPMQKEETDTNIEEDKRCINSIEELPLTETYLNPSTLIKERFFIFDEITEEEILKCQINSNRKHYINVDEKICGEIIHKTREEFSINCYICWDNDNWTFKKFNDLKLFSAHLNSKHSNDQINLQNQRGNSYSLDFVNENSCVMPQSMWFGIYNEMISLKCGFAKINSNGYILYSCLECKSNFKNFTTFTKHILGRENQEKENKNCVIHQDPPPENDSSVSVPLNLFNNCKNDTINNIEDGSDVILNKITSSNNEKNTDTVNNIEDRSEVALNKFTSSNNEKNADTVNNEDGSNIALKKSTTCNNEEKTDTINNIEDGSDITLNSHTSCNSEKNEDTVNNIEDRSEVALNKFTSSNNEKNAGTVNNEDGSNIALKKSTTCNNEKKAETINNIEEGSDALNSLTSCNNENSSDRVNNVEDGSDVLLNSFTSGNNEKNDDKVKNFEDDPNVTLNSLTSCNNEKEKDLANNIKEKNIENEISSPTVKGILESILGKSKVENNMESNENNLLNVQPTNDSLENIEVNQINTEQPIENMKPSCVMKEVDLKSDLEKLARPDTFGYKKITSTLFSILNNDQDESASTKLNKILSLGLNYRDIKEKEKHELEEREKEKLTILSLSVQKDTRLEDPNMLSKNILDLDNKLALLTCKYCNRRYNCVTNLREHFRVHVGDRVLLCLICKRGFSKKSNLEEHIKKFHISTSDLQNIDLDALGDNRKEIARNTNITINENNPKEKGYKCQYCPRFLSNRTALEEHLRIHFGEKPFKCEECNLEFLKKIVYDNHIIEYHTDETEAPRNNLDNFEMNSYDKENNKPFLNKMKLNGKFKCKHCPASYLTRTELIDHLYFHNDGEFKCKFCEQRFDSTKKRCYHEKLHKINSKFKCNFCNKQFPNLYGLEVHENTHKQGALFKCRFCDHYFASENTRSLHEDIHDTVSETNKNLQIQTVDIATILQMNNEQAPMSSNANTNDSNGTSSDGTDRSSNQNTTARNFMVKKIIKKIKRGKRDPNSPLDCRYCKKHFESPHQLSYHERLHEIGKKFQCNICDKIMATSYALELHVTAHLRKKNFSKGFINNKFNGSTFLAHQLRPKIEIVSDITLAPNQTMEILNNFFKREIPSITVTTTSEDESFQKIGVDDIEKNLTAHVLRDTDPYYQLMADFSYQYQMYQNKSISETNESNPIEVPEFVVDREFKATTASKSKKNRKKKVNSETIEDAEDSVFSKSNFLNEENNFEKQNENDFENQTLEITENKTSPESDHSTLYKDSNNKKREKKKISPDVSKNITSVYIKCEYCNKKFNSSDKKSLNHHRRLHIAGDSHKCSFCKKCFATVYYLDKHLRVHHLNDVSEHKCKSCDLVYALKEALRRHELRAHRDIKAKSTQINEKSNEIKDNINHKNCNEKISINTIENNNSNENNEQKFAIPEIPKKSNRRSRSKELKLFHCDFCEKSFPAFNSIQKHINRVHKKDAEDFEANFKFKCTYENCNKKFEFQTNLEKHLRLHESGFKCSICSKKTISQILLDHHMKSHGLPTSHACKYCTSRFTLELSREIHERKVHFKEHNLSYTQITEALSSASTGLTAIQPVELIENPHDEDQQMATTELTPLTTITSLTSLTPLTPLQPTEVFVHTDNDNRISQLQQHHLETSNSIELTPLEPSTISEATKLSLTLLEPSALSELTAFTEPSSITIHSSNLTDLNLSYVDHSSGILNHEHTVLTEFTSSATSTDFETQLITTQCNNNTMLNSSSASSDYAVTNMDTSLITQQVKKPRISDSNIHIETFSSLNDNINQQDLKTQITNFPTFDCTTQFLSTQTSSDLNIAFTDTGLSSKSIMSDSTSLEPLTYSDSMPLSEATTILELTSSSHPTSSSEATAYSESNNFTSTLLNSSGKKKRNSGGKQLNRSYKPNENDLLTLEGDFETCSENNHFKCTLCRRVYDVWIKFRKHNEYHLQRPYQCSICPCNFKTNEELLSHNKAHESTKNNFSCEICNRVFISKSRLKAHMLTVHNDERQFKCDYCPSAFKTKSRLVDHVRCHTGEKPIKCHYCDDHFSRAAYRLKHERAIHPELLEIDTKHKEEKLMEKKNSNKEK